ncbi:heme exporter protein CcmD [Luteimonas sp. MC1572]|uniref:heme exporter protein CcmD n=1 Tax=Luteimonas sp. MC1572 TaxID=2799325 RepID=UPI0018F0F060|nr:heme exporter protein CcmD [Luteimonas sp. MC1572]MBJ6980729.1 heme exporter protein CcmD [Luteimonas sp. MC1572]MBJ7574007.1 heme exporter protein CcmD [Luteimonas sp. MC1828]QQO02099.1 heme exporter protein CcmD [Luteimonas sp. MC1572]
MSYREYVIAAYAVFVAMLAWDFVIPRLRIARQLRIVRRQSARQAPRRTDTTGELKR